MQRTAVLGFIVAITLFAGDLKEDLLNAARKGDLASVKASLEKGAPLEAKTPYGQTPVYLAAMNGQDEVAQFLLSKRANPDVHDTFYKASMLGFVLERKHYGIAKMLIAKGAGNADENIGGASESGNAELVQAVLDKGKPSQKALDKAYAAALEQKQAPVAEVLKKAGAQEPAPAFQVDPKLLESYAGNYKSEQLPLDVKVFAKESKLYVQASGQPEFAPKATSPTAFEFAPANLEIEFDTASSFSLKQGSTTYKFKKVVAQ